MSRKGFLAIARGDKVTVRLSSGENGEPYPFAMTEDDKLEMEQMVRVYYMLMGEPLA